MTREQKIARAEKLYDQGLLYREIGEQLGVSASAAWKWLNPEQTKKQRRSDNARNRPAGRKREREGRTCPECGGPIGRRGAERCWECYARASEQEARERAERFIARRKAGLLNTEIEQEEGIEPGSNVVGNALSKASRRYGLVVPPSPYRSAGS